MKKKEKPFKYIPNPENISLPKIDPENPFNMQILPTQMDEQTIQSIANLLNMDILCSFQKD